MAIGAKQTAESMTKREMNLRVFDGRPLPHTFFQPRIEPWIDLHKREGTLPETLVGLDMYQAYDALDISMRYVNYFTGAPSPIDVSYSKEVRVHSKEVTGGLLNTIETPYGALETRYGMSHDGYRIVDFPVKTSEDFQKAAWFFQGMCYVFNQKAFDEGARMMGDLGEPQFFVPRSPYQTLSLDWMRYEDFVVALMEMPEEVQALMDVIDASYDRLYEQLADAENLHIINFGENIDARLMSPALFERYHLPFYEKHVPPLREAGIYTTVHLDGSLGPLLPYLGKLPMDALEALTPTPQGDVTIEQLKESLDDKILMDGIPAVLFLAEFSDQHLQDCVAQLVDQFAPRLVLGISDELPMGAGPEGLDRLLWVRDFCKTH
jgi:hypothetical protein